MKLSDVIGLLTLRGSSSTASLPSSISIEAPATEPINKAKATTAPLPSLSIATASQPSMLDLYVASALSPQNALDLFKGEWSSALSEPFSYVNADTSQLFNDICIYWSAEESGGFANKSVLELGPLEGGHTCMVEKLGASSIIEIESNTRAFLKSLINYQGAV